MVALIEQKNMSCTSYVREDFNKNDVVSWWNACSGMKFDLNTPFGIGLLTSSNNDFCPTSMEIVFKDAKRTKYCTQFRYDWYDRDHFSGETYLARKGEFCNGLYGKKEPEIFVNPFHKLPFA